MKYDSLEIRHDEERGVFFIVEAPRHGLARVVSRSFDVYRDAEEVLWAMKDGIVGDWVIRDE